MRLTYPTWAGIALASCLLLAASPGWAKPDFVVDTTADNEANGCDVGNCTFREAAAHVSNGEGKSIGCSAEAFPAGGGATVPLNSPVEITITTGFSLDCAGRSIILANHPVRLESGVGEPVSKVRIRGIRLESDLSICAGTGSGNSCNEPVSKLDIRDVRAEDASVDGGVIGQVTLSDSVLEGSFAVNSHSGGDIQGVTVLRNHMSRIELNSDADLDKVKILGNTVEGDDIEMDATAGDGWLLADNVLSDSRIDINTDGTLTRLSILKNSIDSTGGSGIALDADLVKARVDGNTVAGNGSSGTGIEVSTTAVKGLRMAGNRVSNHDGWGIYFSVSTLEAVQLSGNRVVGHTGDAGFYLSADGKKVRVEKNLSSGNPIGFELNSGPFELSKNRALGNGVGIDASSASDCTFKGNAAYGNTSQDIRDGDACATHTWKGNRFDIADAACVE